MSDLSFIAQFGEYTPLYRGITETWVGTGDSQNPGNPEETSYNDAGILYAKYISNDIQTIGSITDYALAVEAGFVGSFADWITFLSETADHVVNAEKWATGNASAQPGDQYTTGNSAKEQADRAAMWASGNTTGDASATNNAKYYAEQAATASSSATEAATQAGNRSGAASLYASEAASSASSASTSATNAQSAASRASSAASSASTYASQANSYKNTAATSATNATNAKDSAVSAKNDAVTAKNNAVTAKNDAETARDAAATWATGGATGTPSATNNAKYYSDLANTRITNLGDFLSSATTQYANSSTATVPVSGWADTATPVQGQYTWSKTTFTWTGNIASPTVVYNVSYVGADSLDIQAITNNEIDALFT